MAYVRKRQAVFTVGDINGRKGKTGLWLPVKDAGGLDITPDASLTAAEATAVLIRNCSTGGLQDVGLKLQSVDAAFVAAAADAEGYQNVEDKATLTFTAADGSTASLSIPAPLEACFKSDDKTIDPANAAIAALIAIVKAKCVTYAGAAITEYLRGRRDRKRNRK